MNKFCLIVISALLLSACENTPKAKRTHLLSPAGFISATLSSNYALLGNLKGYAEFWRLKPRQSNTSGKAGGLKTVNRSKRAYLFTT